MPQKVSITMSGLGPIDLLSIDCFFSKTCFRRWVAFKQGFCISSPKFLSSFAKETALNFIMKSALCTMDILTRWIPIHELRWIYLFIYLLLFMFIYLCLLQFVSSLSHSFQCVDLHFLFFLFFFTSLMVFILKYFILFDDLVNGIF